MHFIDLLNLATFPISWVATISSYATKAALSTNMNFITESLIVAAREGNLAQVKQLVLNKGHDINTKSSKYKVSL